MIDILKFNKAKQFPKDEILNDDQRLVRSWMSVEVKDKQGDIVPITELKRVLNTWMKRGATMMDQHTNRPIGRGLRWQEDTHPKSGTQGIILDYQVYDDYSIDDQVWDEIKSGQRTGVSIGGRALGRPSTKEDEYTGEKGKYLKDIELYEVSPVDAEANQFASNIAVNYLAKGRKKEGPEEFEKNLMEDLTKGYASIEVQKPFAGFQNFQECVAAQEERGHGEESQKRICAWLMHRTEKQFMENKQETDNEGEDETKEKNKTKQEEPEEEEREPIRPIVKPAEDEDIGKKWPVDFVKQAMQPKNQQ